MHADEVEVDDALVRSLLRAQAPQWADLPLQRVATEGTDHAVLRLGDDLSVRLPKTGWAVGQGEREQRWLPRLAPHLGVEVPVPVLLGEPQEGFPHPWYVAPWLAGDHPRSGSPGVVEELAALTVRLQAVDATGAPGPQPGERGGPLRALDPSVRASAEQLRGETDVDALLAAWQAGVEAPPWQGPPVWLHGDLMEGNLLVRGGRLAAVLDWGSVKAGDPAVDAVAAWTLFGPRDRAALLAALPWMDGAGRLRARAWAVCAAVRALPYYRDTNADIVARSWRVVDAVLGDGHRPSTLVR